MSVFASGFTAFTQAMRTIFVLADDGTANGKLTVAQMLGLISYDDMKAPLLQALDIIEPCPDATSYTVVAADRNKTKSIVSNSANAFYLPQNMPVGFELGWIQTGSGIPTFQSVAGAGQTVKSLDSVFRSAGQNASGGLKVVAVNTWLVTGPLQA